MISNDIIKEYSRLLSLFTQKDLQIAGIMHSVDKFLDNEELREEDPVKRACKMRENVLSYLEELEKENRRLKDRLYGMDKC